MSDCRFTLAIPLQHPAYAGHFPGNPIVPGALLLQWLQAELEARLPGHELREVASVKFLHPVLPGDQLAVTAAFRAGTERLSLTATGAEGISARATLVFPLQRATE